MTSKAERDPNWHWQSFLRPADEWLVAYASLPMFLTSVHIFAIGHALELYLKAAAAKLAGDHLPAIGRGHRIDLLLNDCAVFLPAYQLRQRVLLETPLSAQSYEQLKPEDREHYHKNAELYLVASGLKDWKYFGAPRKKSGQMAFAVIYPNDYWISLIRKIRDFLGHPDPNRRDLIAHAINENELSAQAARYLWLLYK